MKKNILVATMALAMAFTTVMGSANTLTVYATDDGCDHGDGRVSITDDGGGNFGDSSDSSSSSSSSSSSGSSSGSSESYSGGGSSDSGSNGGGGSSYDSGSTGAGGGDNGASTASAPVEGLARKGNTVSVAGHETFRQINKASAGTVAIYHCGIEQYTAQLKDADGNAVGYTSCSLYLDDLTGKWYLDIITNTADCTVGTYKGSVTYLPKLGISGVMVNDVIMVDAEAAAAAAK